MANIDIKCKSSEFKYVDMFLMSCEFEEIPPFDDITVFVDDVPSFEYETLHTNGHWYIVTK